MVAHGAALVVMHHDALAHLGLDLGHAGTDRGDDAAGLVPGDDRLGGDRQSADQLAAFRPAVLVQIAAAHAGGLHFQHDLALAGGRVGKLHQFELTVAQEHHAAHRFLPRLTPRLPHC